jgi:hypothetical protein
MRTILTVLSLGLMTLAASSCGGGGSGSGATQVAVSVTGSAPKGAGISYGSDSTAYAGHFPLHTTLPLYSRAGYYYLSAHLKNGGNVTCKLTIGNASSVGHARNGHKVCLAKLTNDYQGHWH